ncbi:MAG: hypothetical protein H0X26_02380 [Alphaproteobacteria bacterium]|nr:hypothetical protein [Alphaproteobacteria bacterium]
MRTKTLVSASALIALFAVTPVMAQDGKCVPKRITFINDVDSGPLSVNIIDCNNNTMSNVNVPKGKNSYNNVGNDVYIELGNGSPPIDSKSVREIINSDIPDGLSITCKAPANGPLTCTSP